MWCFGAGIPCSAERSHILPTEHWVTLSAIQVTVLSEITAYKMHKMYYEEKFGPLLNSDITDDFETE